MRRQLLWLAIGCVATACSTEKTYEPKDFGGASATPAPSAPAAVARPEPAPSLPAPKPALVEAAALPSEAKGRVLLVAMSRFKPDEKGQYTVPDAAELLILGRSGALWSWEAVTDRDSNVFHKALPYGKEGILTIGANKAMLKLWSKKDGQWQGRSLWNPVFGGKNDRLRDFEIADFDRDGKADLAIATHDQGVVAVVWRRGDKWEPEELDRKAETWVHEIEVGDLDKDGKLEIYATPSEPNTVSGERQGGKIVRFRWDGQKFEKSEVAAFEDRHIKEILVTDLDGDGTEELYAAIEAKVEDGAITSPVEIRRYDWKDGQFESSKVAELNDRFCRFLLAGDIDRDGKKELVATAFSSGVWLIKHVGEAYKLSSIDPKSSGFEHAAYMADIDGDGQKELYVADDKRGIISTYEYIAGMYRPKIIFRRANPGEAMVWNITDAEL